MQKLVSKEKVLSQYLNYLDIPVSSSYCEKLVASHPHHTTLLSIADTLKLLGVPNKIFRIKREELENISFPYVLHLNTDSGELIAIMDSKDLEEKQPFLEDWDGVVLKAEPTPIISDEENQSHISKERDAKISSVLFVAAVAFLLFLLFIQNISWVYFSFLITAAAGTVLGYILVAKDLGIEYKAVMSFCNKGGMRTSCDQVLGSQDAKIFGRVTFSDAVLSYFSFQLIIVGLIAPVYENPVGFLWVLSMLSVPALPIIGYSLYSQFFKLQYWCKLCLFVDGILMIQAVLGGLMYSMATITVADYSFFAIGVSIFLFTVVSSLIFLLKLKLAAGKRATQAEIKANRIKYNPSVFSWLLSQEKQLNITPFDKELQVGSPTGSIKIVMAASFSCIHCKKSFQKFTQLNELYPGQLNLVFRFLPDKELNNKGSLAKTFWGYWLLQIYEDNEEIPRTKQLIQDKFTLSSDTFKEKYKQDKNIDDKLIEDLSYQQAKWFDMYDIKSTPSFFIQDHQLPDGYQINDLKRLIPGLIEASQEKNNQPFVPFSRHL
ncbi:vitamin K epoxide reductase family protein [Fodinibius halophilus]|uniref:Thioredoxin domain-containing protein n=1 Tax=Fodinibius halophilus TaxID=1736908 RepID=A0A6M1TFT2_9BACT|nr:vitamin K epoxide reductase family protein [Fodinibius halophilus]NGP87490.1 thioredoxin domain-containing protein [Fodinibius halophilus]